MKNSGHEPSNQQSTALADLRDHLVRGTLSLQYRMRSDADLIGLARTGNNAAFDELASRHRDRIYGLALHALGSVEDAADAMCETFVTAYRGLDSIATGCTPRGWLYVHALRAICSRMRNGSPRFA